MTENAEKKAARVAQGDATGLLCAGRAAVATGGGTRPVVRMGLRGLSLVAKKVGTQEAQELAAASWNAVAAPFAHRWGLNFAEAGDGTSAPQRIDYFGVRVLFFGHAETIGAPKLLVNRSAYTGIG